MKRTLLLSEKFISKSKIFWAKAEKVNFIFHFWGHRTGNFEKKTLKQQQRMNKDFWNHFKNFGRIAGKHLSAPQSQQD